MLKIYLMQTAGLLLVFEALRHSGAHPASLFMAFLVNYFYRLLTLRAALRAAPVGAVPAWVRFITRPPCGGDKNDPLRQGDPSGPPAPIYAYFLTILVTGYMGFMLAHAVTTSSLDVTWGQALAELLSAAGLALIWWIQDLANGAVVADVRRDLTYNLGFNSHEASISAFTVLTGAVIMGVGDAMGFRRSPWMVIGPLLFYKWVWGVWVDKRYLIAAGCAVKEGTGDVA